MYEHATAIWRIKFNLSDLYPEQFTVKAHPALFEGGEEGEGQKKVRNNTFIPVYIPIHIQNQTLKSNISKTVRDRKCQWKLDRKSCMGFRMMEIFLTSGDL